MSNRSVIATYYAFISDKRVRKFDRRAVFMNSTWNAFNKYAKGRGFTEMVEGKEYLGYLAWRNPMTDEVMELRKEDIKGAV